MAQVFEIIPCGRQKSIYSAYTCTMIANGLVMQGTRASGARVLTQLSQNIVLAPDRFKYMLIYKNVIDVI